MLVPAILYKEQIEKAFAAHIYDTDYFYYIGYAHGHELADLQIRDNRYEYAVLDNDDHLIGYFSFTVFDVDTVENFGLYSFDRGNPLVTVQVYQKMKQLVNKYRRISWRVIDGNPVKPLYDRFCNKYNGQIHHYRECTRDDSGKLHGEYVYEILRSDWMSPVRDICE